jgi:hypothetical protein
MGKNARRSLVRVLVFAAALAVLSIAPSSASAAPGGYSQADIDRAIQRGVDWLSTQQQPDGSFDSSSGFPEAETGLAIVSYGVLANGDLSFGTVPNASAADRARWRSNVEHAVDNLLAKQNANGSWDGFLGTYSTGIALLALSYAGDLQSPTRNVSGAIAKGRRFLIMTQNAPPSVTGNTGTDADIPGPTPDCSSAPTSSTAGYCGGWNYSPSYQRSDQSNTGFALTGLAATGGVPDATAKVNVGWQRNVQMLKTNPFTATGGLRNGKPANDGGGSYEPFVTTGDFASNANDTGSLIFGFGYDKVPGTDVGAKAATIFGTDVIDEYELEKGVTGAPRTMVFHTGAERDGTCTIGEKGCTWEFAPGEGGYHYSIFALSKGLGQYLPSDPAIPENFYAKVVDLLLSEQTAGGDDPGSWPNDPRDDGSQIGATAFAIMSLGRVGQPANVSGTVYEDADGNQTRGPGEAGLANWTVYADLDDDGVLDAGEPSARTAANGTYTIQRLPETTGSIREVGQSGFECTAPPAGCAYRGVEFSLGANIGGKDFGNRHPPAAAAAPAGGVLGARACGSARRFTIRVRIRRSLRTKVKSVQVRVAGQKVRAHRRGKRWVAVVNLRSRPKGTYRVKLRIRLRSGKLIKGTRTYHTCVKRRKGHGPPPV